MAPRPQPLGPQPGDDTFPAEFYSNQLRQTGRGMRPVKENSALTSLKADLTKNAQKAARAKATKQARLSQISGTPSSSEHVSMAQTGRLAQLVPLEHSGREFSPMTPFVDRQGHASNPYEPHPASSPWMPLQEHNPQAAGAAFSQYAIHPPGTPNPLRVLQPIQEQSQHSQMSLLEELNNATLSYNGVPMEQPSMSNTGVRDLGLIAQEHHEVGANAEAAGDDGEESDDHEDEYQSMSTGLGLKINDREVDFVRKHQKRNTARRSGALPDSEDTGEQIESDGIEDAKRKAGRASRSVRLLPDDAQRVIKLARELLQMHISKIDPWPDAAKTQGQKDSNPLGIGAYEALSMELWYEASSTLKPDTSDASPGNDELKRILESASSFRGQIREKASLLVAHAYGINDTRCGFGRASSPQEQDEITAQNRKIYASVKKSFWFTDPSDKTLPDSMFRHPIIQHVFNLAWFGQGTSARSKFFAGDDQVSLETIAFILTAVENALDAWRTGQFTRVDFTCKEYHSIYEAHRRRLQLFKKFSAQEAINQVVDIQQSLLKNARSSIGHGDDENTGGTDQETEEELLAMFIANRPAP